MDYKNKSVNNRSVKLHRFIWEQVNGPIPKGYCIHHKDGDILNNDISNLEMMTYSDHVKLHQQLNKEGIYYKKNSFKEMMWKENNKEHIKEYRREYYKRTGR